MSSRIGPHDDCRLAVSAEANRQYAAAVERSEWPSRNEPAGFVSLPGNRLERSGVLTRVVRVVVMVSRGRRGAEPYSAYCATCRGTLRVATGAIHIRRHEEGLGH